MKKRQWLLCLLVLLRAAALAQDSTSAKSAGATGASATGTASSNPTTVKSSSAACGPELFLGATLVFEGATPRFTTFGPQVAITFPVAGRVGIMADAGYYLGSNQGVNYSKFQGMVGVSYLPIGGGSGAGTGAGGGNKVTVSPYLLAGIADVGSKYSYSGYSFSDHSTAPAAALGAMVNIPLNNNLSISLRGDFNPTFNHGTQANFRLGAGLAINLGGSKCKPPAETTGVPPNAPTNGPPPSTENNLHTTEKPNSCVASPRTKDLTISFAAIETIANYVRAILNKPVGIETVVNISPSISVTKGEECCSKDKPPVEYTELKAGANGSKSTQGSVEINLTLWGLPDLDFEQKLWPYLIKGEFKLKVFAGPKVSIGLQGIGRFYGSLGLIGERVNRPDCKSCFYFNVDLGASIQFGLALGGSVAFYRWKPFNSPRPSYDVNGEPDGLIQAKASAVLSLGVYLNGTYGFNAECKPPPPGLHGKLTLGKLKADFALNIDLGPLSFATTYTVPLLDGFDFTF
jgi:hypothetical protein